VRQQLRQRQPLLGVLPEQLRVRAMKASAAAGHPLAIAITACQGWVLSQGPGPGHVQVQVQVRVQIMGQ
jgi:hypothetical protein